MLKRLSFHILFWTIIAGIHLSFVIRFLPPRTALLSTLTVLVFQALTFYVNIRILFPRFFSLSRAGRFFLISILFVVAVTLAQILLEYFYLSRWMMGQGPPLQPKMIPMMFMRSVFWILFMDLTGTVFMMQDRMREQTEQTQKMAAEKLATELKLLKSQINPHFIFNALNNIYSLAYMKSEKAAESVLKLSGMLRYVIEECEQEKVPLRSEIEYIQNYIAFQKMKSPEEQDIGFDCSGADPNVLIAPMLFNPLIENSFKYSKIAETRKAFIRIGLKTDGNELHFRILNSVPDGTRMQPGAGTGLKNVRQRLEIIYPEKHGLDIEDRGTEFGVHLRLALQ
jgi:hypothetical protein